MRRWFGSHRIGNQFRWNCPKGLAVLPKQHESLSKACSCQAFGLGRSRNSPATARQRFQNNGVHDRKRSRGSLHQFGKVGIPKAGWSCCRPTAQWLITYCSTSSHGIVFLDTQTFDVFQFLVLHKNRHRNTARVCGFPSWLMYLVQANRPRSYRP